MVFVKFKTAMVLLFSLVFIWGLNWPINKIALEYTSPTNFIELRFIVSTIAVFFLVVITNNFVIPRKKDLPIILMVGFFQLGLMIILCNYGLSLVDAGRATFLVYATSIWMIPLTALLDQKINRFDVFGLSFGLVGVILLMSPWQSGWPWKGDLALVLSSLSWSIGILCARRLKWHYSSIQLFPWQLLVATLCAVVFALLNGVSLIPRTINFTLITALFYTSIIAIGLASWIMIKVSLELSTSLISLGLICVPIVSLLISYLFLKEPVSLLFMIAILCILVGILMHSYSERKMRKKTQGYNDVP